MTLRNLSLALLLAVPLAGCGDILGGGDGGTADMTMSPDLLPGTIYKLVSGDYKIVKLSNKVDGCQIDSDPMSPILGLVRTLTNDGMGNVSVQGFGTGVIAYNMGTLNRMEPRMVDTCTYDLKRVTKVKVTADNYIVGDFREDQTNRKDSCLPKVGPMCTTTWIMELQKQ